VKKTIGICDLVVLSFPIPLSSSSSSSSCHPYHYHYHHHYLGHQLDLHRILLITGLRGHHINGLGICQSGRLEGVLLGEVEWLGSEGDGSRTLGAAVTGHQETVLPLEEEEEEKEEEERGFTTTTGTITTLRLVVP